MKWNLMPKAPGAFLKQFPEFSPLIGQLLYNRNLKSQKQINEFLNPDYNQDLQSPHLLKGMKKAVRRLLEGIKKNEKIVIYGDYDADGVCASAILFYALKESGLNELKVYIPDRAGEGYGLNEKAIRSLAKQKTDLIVTVDCGSTNLKEAVLARDLGVDLIVTDHHQLRDELPECLALVNPWQKGDKYPFKYLSGAGVAYKLACALLSAEKNSRKEALKKWLLDLAAIATVADVMPIVGENRTLVKYGLGVLAQTRWPGLKKLMEVARLKPCLVEPSIDGRPPLTNLDGFTLAYVIGPHLNAAGRMDHANTAFHLLISRSRKKAEKLAKRINRSNCARQKLTEKIIQAIDKRLGEEFNEVHPPQFIFEGDPDWPTGLVGLVAGKFKDRYNCPTVVFCEEDGLIRASCRSIEQFNLVDFLEKNQDLLEKFGGHKVSAGFRARKENLNELKRAFDKAVENKLKDKDLTPVIDIDAEMELEDVNWKTYEQIQSFAPFAKGNPEPAFLARNLELNRSRTVGNGNRHLKLELTMFGRQSKRAKTFKAIAFSMADRIKELKQGNLLDIVFKLIANEWNGYRELEMKIVDIKHGE